MNKVDMIKAYINKKIEDGKIVNGQRLPSCREISKELLVNKITVNKAFHELELEHVVYVIPRGGYYLVDRPIKKAKTLSVIDFNQVTPEKRLIPFREFSHAMNKAIDLYKDRLFIYEDVKGLIELRQTLSEYFMKDGIYTDTENIIITHGAQQALNLVLNYLSTLKETKLLVEVPTYSLPLRIAEQLGIPVVGIERKCSGYDLNTLERIFRDEHVTAFYMIPRHHNPTGFSLSEKDKQIICNMANHYNVLIIEDDYLADLGSKKGYLPIHYYDVEKKGIYIRSFSKTFMPGIRLGAAVLPRQLITKITELKYLSDLNSAQLPQAALDIFIKSGMYERHIKKIKRIYESKMRRAYDVTQSQCPEDLKMFIPERGIFIWVELPKAENIKPIISLLQKKGINISDASDHYYKPINEDIHALGNHNIRLCISGISEEDITQSLATFFSIYRDTKK